MVQAITIVPSAEGWAVKSETFNSEMFFSSGAKAEAAARSLASRIARTGEPVEIEIYLRDGALGGRYGFDPEGTRAPRVRPEVF